MDAMNLPWHVEDTPDWGLAIIDAQEGCVAYFAYPDDEDRRTYNDARRNAEAICVAVNEKWVLAGVS